MKKGILMKKRSNRPRKGREQNRKSKAQRSGNKRAGKYGAAVLAFVLMIVSALWLPQIFFDVSDALRYGKVSLTEQEKPDVLTLTTGYEESLYSRLAGFAEGLADQRQYYVDEQPKEITEEIREFLFESEFRFNTYSVFGDVVMGLFSEALGFLPEELGIKMYAGNTELEMYRWKQYVIYSDDYAQGVNFILWCFGLKNASGDDLTILMDAHDYTVYAVQLTGGGGLQYSVIYNEQEIVRDSIYSNTWKYMRSSLWMALDIYYNIFEPEELESFFANAKEIYETWGLAQTEKIAGVLHDTAGNAVEIYLGTNSDVPYGAEGEDWYGRDSEGLWYYSLPLGENKLTFGIHGFETPYNIAPRDTVYAMGIREICELIPEFRNIG